MKQQWIARCLSKGCNWSSSEKAERFGQVISEAIDHKKQLQHDPQLHLQRIVPRKEKRDAADIA